MASMEAVVAITGMNATDNPAPGVAVARSLRHAPSFQGRLVGLGYDALDPGFYTEGLLDGGAILPYPSAGKEALLDTLGRVRDRLGMDVLVPTLDAEMHAVTTLEPELRARGIHTFVPSPDSLERASKPRLHELGLQPGIHVPDSEAIVSADGLHRLVQRFGLPVMVKGVYYGGTIAHSEADAIHAFHRYVATWGVPVVVQRFIAGEAYNVAALGDGQGGVVGAVPMRKMRITDKGKGWCGVTVESQDLLDVTQAVVRALSWRGPLEIELLRERGSGRLYVIEINPRFPAWVYLTAGAGQNLPLACVSLALGQDLSRPLPAYRPGTLFVRVSLDQISDLSTFEQLTASGLLTPREVRP